MIGIRPEDIWEYEDAVHRGFDEASVNIVETITAREMPGAEVILYFDAQNKSHAVRLRPDNQTRTGEEIQLYFDPEKFMYLIKKPEKIYFTERKFHYESRKEKMECNALFLFDTQFVGVWCVFILSLF